MSFLSRLFGHNEASYTGGMLYAAVGTAARHPVFFETYQAPDTLDGRFDMLLLVQSMVSILLLEREEQEILREMQEQLIRDMDRNLREFGVGDMSVGKQIKAMGAALLGRQSAYHAAYADKTNSLADTIRRNVFKGDDSVSTDEIAALIERLIEAWRPLSTSALSKGLPMDIADKAYKDQTS